MENTAKKITSLSIVKDMADQEINVLTHLLLTDPLKINSAIDILTKRKQKADADTIAKCDAYIAKLYSILEQEIDTTLNIYNIPKVENTETESVIEEPETKKDEEETKSTMVHQPPKQEETEDKSKTALRVVRDDSDNELRKKYESIVKQYTVDKFAEYLKGLSKEDAIEAATFILGNGLYQAKKPKKWENERLLRWLNSVVFKTEQQTEETTETTTEKTTEMSLEEKYKNFANELTLAQVGEQIKYYVTEGNAFQAVEFASYILINKLYKVDKEDSHDWTPESVQIFIEQVTDGMSSTIETEEAKVVDEEEAPFWDITYREVYKMIDDLANKEGMTLETLKNTFMKFMEENSEKSIETIDDLVKESDLETVWTNLFDSTMKFKLTSLWEKRNAEKFEIDNEALKKEVVKDFVESYLNPGKDKIESGEITVWTAISELKKRLHEKGFKSVGLPEAKNTLKELAEQAAFSQSILKKLTPSPKSTETKNPENVAIVGAQVPVDDKYPEIKEEVEKAKYLEDMYYTAKKYISDPDKNAYVLQLVTNAFLDGKVFNNAKDTEPIKWDLAQITSWLSTNIEIPEETTEESKEKPVVDAETDISKSDEESNPPAEEETTSDINEYQKAIHKAHNGEGFRLAIGNFIKHCKEQGDDVKTIRTKCVSEIEYARSNNKKSFARSSYKRAQVGELHNAINKIAINAEIEGFMNK